MSNLLYICRRNSYATSTMHSKSTRLYEMFRSAHISILSERQTRCRSRDAQETWVLKPTHTYDLECSDMRKLRTVVSHDPASTKLLTFDSLSLPQPFPKLALYEQYASTFTKPPCLEPSLHTAKAPSGPPGGFETRLHLSAGAPASETPVGTSSVTAPLMVLQPVKVMFW